MMIHNRYNAYRIYRYMAGQGAGDYQGSGGDGHSSTTNNRAEDIVRQEGTRRRLNTLISKIIYDYQQQ